MEKHPLTETWEIHNRINLFILNALEDGYLQDLSLTKGRTVGEQFAHLHNVRLMWLKESAPDLLQNMHEIERGKPLDIPLLRDSLSRSGEAVSVLIHRSLENDGQIKGFKPHITAFTGYLIAHESHHRGQIILILKQAGHPVDRKTGFGIWEWGVR